MTHSFSEEPLVNNLESRLHESLKGLKLPTVKALYRSLAESALKNSLTYEQYLLELVEHECEHRRNNAIERHLRESRLPLEKNFETFDLSRLPAKTARLIASLRDATFLDRKENILAFGNPGTGKTHLLCALAQELVTHGRRVFYCPCSELVQNLLHAKQELRLPRTLKSFQKFDAILLDDIGYVQQSREEMEVLFELLAARYERGSVLITSNLPFSKWEAIFKNPMTTAAVIDRLIHHCVIIELNLKSYRQEHAQKKITKS